MITRNSNKNNNHCIRCQCVYTPDSSLSAEEYPYCTACNFQRTQFSLKIMKEVNFEGMERKAGKRHRQKKIKQYRPDFVAQVT